VKMSWRDYVAKRTELSKLVATELWTTRERVGSYDKGDYLYLNRMHVHNQADYRTFEHDVWRPFAEVMIKDGLMKSWSFHTLVLPSGTDVRITAVTADVIGSWEAVFKQNSLAGSWKKVHPGKNIDKTLDEGAKLRDLARRDLCRPGTGDGHARKDLSGKVTFGSGTIPPRGNTAAESCRQSHQLSTRADVWRMNARQAGPQQSRTRLTKMG
jgi:hypothetical protein